MRKINGGGGKAIQTNLHNQPLRLLSKKEKEKWKMKEKTEEKIIKNIVNHSKINRLRVNRLNFLKLA